MDSMANNLSFLHSYTIISANSNKNEYCIVKTGDNCIIENTGGTFSLENVQNSHRDINSAEFENVEKCSNQNSVDNTNETYTVENPNEVFPLDDGYCIEIPEEICNTQTINVTIESNQSRESFPCQDLNLLYSNRQVYVCDVCNRAFHKKSNLNRHYRSHTGDNPHICDICDARYPTRSRLKEHQKSHSGERPFICNLCNKTFARTSNLTRHLRIHNGLKRYKCDQCDSCFVEATRLREHYLIHTGEKKHACDLCDKKFLKKSNLKRHYRTHTGEHSHTCETCGRNFSKRIYLLVHIKTHSIEALSCGVQASNHPPTDNVEENQSNNDTSSVIETELFEECTMKGIECGISVENISDNSEINFETYTFKNLDDKLYSCKQCGRHFIKEKSLNTHLQKHNVIGKDPLKCSVCKTNFTHLSRLKEHFITHSGEKPFLCVVCGQKFGRKFNLLRHLLTHTGEKMHQCEICNKQYSNMSRLKEHLLIHTGVKPHRCDICKKFFRHKFGLQRHYLIHTGEKPHKCDLCNKHFSRKSRLGAHYRSHGKILPASHPSSPLDNMFFIHNRVEPRLTQIIENLESRLSELSPNFKKSSSAQQKLMFTPKKCKTNDVFCLNSSNISNQNRTLITEDSVIFSDTKIHASKPELSVSARTRVFKHNKIQSSVKEVQMNENSEQVIEVV
ncbi:Zinc finger protein 45 [Araneus ventricosus]|uniref:Zinc finger protein 45 n=1 Tax=Araneus ventricosus TaxID=182803 RepID=A0A4Y2S9C4_ARAVE|nr:Zinc finger protein 45 [Araneus ventricosus]GBN84848.1 Zinc finger protein 45 [Araneus ventricosus]